jgi:starch synthase
MAPKSPLRIVMFAAEASPYAKVGGLGDVVGALPKALAKWDASPAIVIPAYKAAQSSAFAVRPRSPIFGFDVPMASSAEHAEVFHARMNDSSVDVYLIGSRKYFDRDGIYDDPATKEGYPDNMERFIFFMKAGLELIVRLGTPVDIIHCHDSHTALIPGLLNINYRQNPILAETGTLFTIHNLAHQGLYSNLALDYAGINRKYFYPTSPFEYWGKINFMKAGIELADKVNTVSHTYSVEIQTNHESGMGLEGVLRNRKEDVSGIVNGIDNYEWDPESDPFIPAHFSIMDLSGKEVCKENLLQHFGLPSSRDRVPLIGIVSRLADQKGFDLIEEAIEEIASMDLQMVILGTGQQKYHELFQQIAMQYPAKIGIELSFNNELAHRIEAGSDMFLMPSKFEPCGLNQLYSLRYGTIPIVRKTGGLADTVIPFGRQHSTGFSFSGYSAGEMMESIKRALKVYSDPSQWQPLMTRAMSQDWSWNRSARQYMQLYRDIYLKRHSEIEGNIAYEH